MADPVPALTYAATFAAFTAVLMGGTASLATYTGCTEAGDLLDGDCSTTLHDVLQIVLVGTIPGAPTEVNLFFGLIGLACRATVIVWLIEKGGWVAILGIVAGGVAALVAWLS